MMRTTRLLFFVLLNLCAQMANGEDHTLNKDLDYSLNTGSFVFHTNSPDPGEKKFTQYLQNEYVAIEKKIDHSMIDAVILGTFVNSFNHRCLLLGVQKNWIQFSNRMTLEATYAYAGEFFVEPFSECGAEGFYNGVREATGIGFIPFIYHDIEYDFTPYLSLETGVIFPAILAITLQWHF